MIFPEYRQEEQIPARQRDATRLRICTSRWVDSIFAGEYRSAFRGRGIEFEEVREYQPGDDVRAIDWNVTARTGRPFVKRYIEEREMTVMLLVDRSASLAASRAQGTAARVALDIARLLTLAASRSNDRVGLVAFANRVESFVPPGKGLRHARRVFAELARTPEGCGTDLAAALEFFGRVQRRPCIAIIISDFLASDFALPLASASRHHDLVAIVVTDPLDGQLPRVGLVEAIDPESGLRRTIDLDAATTHAMHEVQVLRRRAERQRNFKIAGVDFLEIGLNDSPMKALASFFLRRASRRYR